MRSKILYKILKYLIVIDPAALIGAIVILLAFALPVAAVIASFGLMNASTFLTALLLVATLFAGLFWLRLSVMYWAERNTAKESVQQSVMPMASSSDDPAGAGERALPITAGSNSGIVDLRLKQENYAEYLMGDVLRTPGPGHLFYHQGP